MKLPSNIKIFLAFCLIATSLSVLSAKKTVKEDTMPYTISELKNGKIVHKSNLISPTERLEAGSIAKYMCSLVVIQALSKELLQLDDSIAKYIPFLKDTELKEVTVETLLSNRSGLSNKIPEVLETNPSYPAQVSSTQKAIKDLLSKKIKFLPNQTFDYEIINWVITQHILEAVYQKPIHKVLMSEIFEKANMSNTNVFSGNLHSSNHHIVSAKSRPIPSFMACAGGVETTPEDLLKLSIYHFNNFPVKAIELSTKLRTKSENYALGARYKIVNIQDKKMLYSHQSGKNGSFHSGLIYIPELNKGIAVMSPNSGNIVATVLESWLNRLNIEKNN